MEIPMGIPMGMGKEILSWILTGFLGVCDGMGIEIQPQPLQN